MISEDLRNELAAIAPDADCDRLAELSGLFHVAGSVHLRGRGEVALHLDLVSSAVARRAFALLRAFREARVCYFQPLELMRTGKFNRATYKMATSMFGETGDGWIDRQSRRIHGPECAAIRREMESRRRAGARGHGRERAGAPTCEVRSSAPDR